MFSDKALKALIIPLFFEQILSISVGMADTMMISYAGEAAISGVALVDLINLLLINVFTAIATGGAVVVSQYLGKGDQRLCRRSADQLLLIAALISLAIMTAVLLFKRPLLAALYRNTEAAVMVNAVTYLRISAYSYPFLAVFHACAALFRSMGNSRISMQVSLAMNITNIIGNAMFIFVFQLGVAGAAWASALSRMMAAAVMVYLVQNKDNAVSVSLSGIFKWDGRIAGKILYIGIPSGIEGGIFQMGRVLVVSIIAGFGTTQIAANAVANNLDNMGCIGGQAMSLAMVTVIGRCLGAGEPEQADYYGRKLMKIAYGLSTVTNGLVLLTLPLVLRIYALTPETAKLATILIWIHCGLGILMWPAAFTLPGVLRAAGDVRFVMTVSIFSMMAFRVVFSVILGIHLGMGALGVWLAMILDWSFRMVFFILRWRKGAWKRLRLVE